MPQRHDKLYHVWNGQLETVTFLEEGLADETCTRPTYLVRDANGRKSRCSIDMHLLTAKAAWEQYLAEAQQSHAAQVRQLAESQVQLEYIANEIRKATDMIRRCDAP